MQFELASTGLLCVNKLLQFRFLRIHIPFSLLGFYLEQNKNRARTTQHRSALAIIRTIIINRSLQISFFFFFCFSFLILLNLKEKENNEKIVKRECNGNGLMPRMFYRIKRGKMRSKKAAIGHGAVTNAGL